MVALPALAHGIEFAMHFLRGTPKLYESAVESVGSSMFTCVLSYWLHRRNVVIVGEGARPLLVYVFQLPGELLDILVTKPIRLLRGTDSPRDKAQEETGDIALPPCGCHDAGQASAATR